ncbi:uncharacterized protein M6B38_257905 [Iris pallida]|uniref:RRM domain-containing protein n=1 Tax=Iris pallida TaxID=29817 RepID=A0AAX6IFB2_IRIPA|nr:uncharacterized protein M6B38_257905 [Iris pallida]
MASTEQPLKKRKLSDPLSTFASPPTFQYPLSHEEILRRRRNKEEIRSLYESYRRIKFCVSQKDARLMPDLEQAYLSLITASRGCTSVQRIVAELIPRFASFCPTALEAAAKVSINMYNWSLAILMRGEDGDGVAYQTAKACIFGLVDICRTASYEAPTSSVIDGICSAVFENVLTFFTSTFEGKDIYKISSKEIQKLQETPESFFDLKQEQPDNIEPPLHRLFRFRALSLLRIFFSFPKNLLAASFDLLCVGAAAVHREGGKYFLNQLTSDLNVDAVTDSLNKIYDGETHSTDSGQNGEDCKGSKEAKSLSSENNDMEKSLLLPKNCFMKMAIDRESSLRKWILSRYKNLSEARKSEDISELSSFLEKLFGSLPELVKEADSAEIDEHNSDQPKYIDPVFSACKIPVQCVDNDVYTRDSLKVQDESVSHARHKDNNAAEKDVCKSLKPQQSLLSQKLSFQSGNSGERFVKLESRDLEDSYPVKPSPKDLTNNHFIPAVPRKQPDFRTNNSDVAYQSVGVEKTQGSNIDLGLPARISASGSVPNIIPSPRQLSTTWHHASSNHILWCGNGDPAAMDVFPASKQLWVGSLGHDASEMLVRLQFEDFGPLEQYIFVPSKDFALIEYKSIMDAVKAREYMQGSSPWGACLHIKFVDRGLGSRGATNGIPVGDSCHVYVGKVSTQWTKDEILHELMMVGMRNPRFVTDLVSEKALLLEFGTSEETVIAMMHIRRQRNASGRHAYPDEAWTMRGGSKDSFASSCQLLVKQIDASVSDEELINAFSRFGEITRWKFNRLVNCCLIDFRLYEFAELAKSHLHGARFGPTSILVEFANGSPQTNANPVAFSPRTASIHDNTIGSSGIRKVNTSGYVSSHGDFYPPNMEGNPINSYHSSFTYKPEPEHSIHELVSPRVLAEKNASQIHNMHAFQSSWSRTSSSEMPELRSRRVKELGSSTPLDHSFAGPATPRAQQVWQYKKQELDPQTSTPGSIPCPPIFAHGGSMLPPPVPTSSFVRPAYPNPSGSWDNNTRHPSFSLNQVPPGMNPADHCHINVRPAIPFIPSSITPLSQLPGGSMQSFDSTVPGSSSLASPPPLPPDAPPPLPSSPPPLPLSQPPSVPPPPSSPLLQPALEPSYLRLGEPSPHCQWQGTLSKSGVHYCTIYATRENSSACNYSNAVCEPVDWPARLDVTKRTDLRHMKTTFASTLPHRREVCRLLPSTANDHKGFHDFISYLKQRDCAGVIKIPAGKFMWARLLFILPHSPDTCSLFAISPHPADSLIALVLPKDTNTESA